MFNFANKTVLVTGAASGIGTAIATRFANDGASVIITDVNQSEGEKLAASLGAKVRFELLNVAHENNWQKIFADIVHLDILVNNAGISGHDHDRGPQDPEHTSLESWRTVQMINLDGVFLGCRFAIQAMKQRGGSIINIASRSGLIGTPEAASYAASKAAVINFTKTVALYCASKKYPIRCNSILPGAILTPIMEPLLGSEEERESNLKAFAKMIPLNCLGMPEDIANAAAFLASEQARYITGTEMIVDGGLGAGPLD